MPAKVLGFFMSESLVNIHLLAFMCAFKAYRRNGIFYAHDKNYKLADALNISCVTFKKYIVRLQDLGLLKPAGKHQQVIGLKDAILVLFPEKTLKQLKHLRFFKHDAKVADFKQYYHKIKFAIANVNYQQQQYQISKYDFLFNTECNRNHRVMGRKLNQLYKKFGVSTFENLLCIIRKRRQIVSGKYHVAKLIGCSAATGARLLKYWHHTKRILRTINTTLIPCFVSHASYDVLKKAGFCFIYPAKDGSGFWVSRGSLISITL